MVREWKTHDVVLVVDALDEENVKFWVTLSVSPSMATLYRLFSEDEPAYLTVVGHLTEVCFPVTIEEDQPQQPGTVFDE